MFNPLIKLLGRGGFIASIVLGVPVSILIAGVAGLIGFVIGLFALSFILSQYKKQ